MKFVVDAHLPRRLCGVLASHGHGAVHTLDLAAGNATNDEAINRISLDERRVVISKDTDFFFSHNDPRFVFSRTDNTWCLHCRDPRLRAQAPSFEDFIF